MVAWNVANVSERVRVSHPAPKIERKSMSDLQLGVTLLLSLIIAYEPVWAIGTGKNETPGNASEIAQFIKKSLVISYKFQVKVLYGGSVNFKNAKSFLKAKNIDGLLVGGASLKAEEFNKIIKSA